MNTIGGHNKEIYLSKPTILENYKCMYLFNLYLSQNGKFCGIHFAPPHEVMETHLQWKLDIKRFDVTKYLI